MGQGLWVVAHLAKRIIKSSRALVSTARCGGGAGWRRRERGLEEPVLGTLQSGSRLRRALVLPSGLFQPWKNELMCPDDACMFGRTRNLTRQADAP